MNSFKRILVLQDDSPQCPVWTRQAADLAALWNARLLGLHVEPKVVRRNYYDSSVGDGLGQVQSSVEKTRERQVLDRFDEVLAEFGVRSHWLPMQGDPVVETRRMARSAYLAMLGYPGKSSDDLNDLPALSSMWQSGQVARPWSFRNPLWTKLKLTGLLCVGTAVARPFAPCAMPLNCFQLQKPLTS